VATVSASMALRTRTSVRHLGRQVAKASPGAHHRARVLRGCGQPLSARSTSAAVRGGGDDPGEAGFAHLDQVIPEWQSRYRADRPKVERKISHFARRRWGVVAAHG
jgi:hypothetical protein